MSKNKPTSQYSPSCSACNLMNTFIIYKKDENGIQQPLCLECESITNLEVKND